MVPSRYFGSCSLIFILVCKAAWQNVPSTAEFNTVAQVRPCGNILFTIAKTAKAQMTSNCDES